MAVTIFTATIFLGSLLLFLVQPMLGKLVLPHVGGAPAAWNTSMLFYQILLLGGYAYVHLCHKWLAVKKQAVLHIALLAAACFAFMPLAFAFPETLDPAKQPIEWLLATLGLTIGMPFFLLSANATLLQFAYANTRLKSADNPYFLYAASNAGSFIGLFSYPFFMEYLFGSETQLQIWSGLFITLALMLAASIWQMWRHYQPVAQAEAAVSHPATPLAARLRWVFLAFVPSSAMLGVTSHITQEVAPVPVIWIIPLAIYLLSFIFVFRTKMIGYERSLNAHVMLLVATFFILILHLDLLFTSVLLIHFFMLYAICMVCHGQLSLSKPHPSKLTEFFLYMSLGGALGGTFNALIAPSIFNSVIEYPMILLLSVLARPNLSLKGITLAKPQKAIACLFVAVALAFLLFNPMQAGSDGAVSNTAVLQIKVTAFLLVTTMAVVAFINYPALCFAIFATYFFANSPHLLSTTPPKGTLLNTRNFFGVSMVMDEGNLHAYANGNTLHGIQPWINGTPELMLTSYYYLLKPLGDALPEKARVGIAGQGVGTTACLSHDPEATVDFYEINPLVVDIADNPNFFTFMRDCKPSKTVTLGDARLKLAEKPDGIYDLLVVDVFTSDSIPLHLMTKEAFEIYARVIKENGIVAINISNRHLNLEPIIGNIARELKLNAKLYTFQVSNDTPEAVRPYARSAVWAVFGKGNTTPGIPLSSEREEHPIPTTDKPVWTDTRSNIIEPIWYKFQEE